MGKWCTVYDGVQGKVLCKKRSQHNSLPSLCANTDLRVRGEFQLKIIEEKVSLVPKCIQDDSTAVNEELEEVNLNDK